MGQGSPAMAVANAQAPNLFIRLLRWISVAILALLVLLLTLVAAYRFVPPVSTLMLGRLLSGQPVERSFVPLERVSPHLIAAVVSSEDARFCEHNGVDWLALQDVIAQADEDGPARGASTIAMQTAKNLFLWPSRSYLRKGLEIPLALLIDLAWPKRRVLEVYLNIAEWGDGIFGVEAAARRIFGKSAAGLTPREAALLATSLPNPLRRDAAKPGRGHSRLAGTIQRRAGGASAYLGCLDKRGAR
jgi:monofunctional glycosyltransferase